MKDIIFDEFQNSINECLFRHRSILDISSKLQESQARVNRAVAKAVTDCGCICIDASKKHAPETNKEQTNYDDEDIKILNKCLNTHLSGKLCSNCLEVISAEIGNNFFYIASLCNLLDLNMYDILIKENEKLLTLGKYNIK